MKDIVCDCEKNCAVSCESISDIMESVALEQAAISHILNTEGEKLQKLLSGSPTVDEMLCVNASVRDTIQDVTYLEILLLGKLKAVANLPCNDVAHNGNFTITVCWCKSHKPIVGAIVQLFDCNQTIVCNGVTDCDGKFCAPCLPFGKYCAKVKNLFTQETKTCCFVLKQECITVCKSLCFAQCPKVCPCDCDEPPHGNEDNCCDQHGDNCQSFEEDDCNTQPPCDCKPQPPC
ncbi:MAG: hypothetical protein RR348_04900, partial [Clostridia bacterium]